MPVSYSVNKTLTTFSVRYRSAGPDGAGNYTLTQQYGFIPFDLAAAGIAAGTVESAALILRCTTIVGGGQDVLLRSSVDPNGFGATLDATNADWKSSRDDTHDLISVTSTGFHTFTVNPAVLSYSGITYFSLYPNLTGSAPFQKSSAFNAKEAGTPSNRPVLRLTLFSGQVIFVQIS